MSLIDEQKPVVAQLMTQILREKADSNHVEISGWRTEMLNISWNFRLITDVYSNNEWFMHKENDF